MKKMYLVFLISSFLLNPILAMSDSSDLEPELTQKAENKIKDQTKFQKLMLEFQRLMSKLSEVPERFSNAPEKISATFNWVAERIDTILTRKGAIKTLLILGPIFALYCYFFPPDPVKALINKIVSSAVQGASDVAISTVDGLNNNNNLNLALNQVTQKLGELQGIYKINQEIGQTSGLWQGIWNSPFSTIGMLISNGVEKGIAIGIPFLLGLGARKLIKP